MSALDIKQLSVSFRSGARTVHAVQDVSISLQKGELMALVGESGSGKSVTALAAMQLLPSNASHIEGEICIGEENILNASDRMLRTIRGKKIAMIFQEPMTALNPLHTIGKQLREMLSLHQPLKRKEQDARISELLDMVGLEKFKDRLHTYPHQLSGGERQRVMIAMAMANNPDVLIADEPTTALDVTLQVQILSLLKKLQKSHDMAILLITHDLTIVKKMAERVAIMQQGKIVETGDTKAIFAAPSHPYTQHLLSCEPKGPPLPIPADAAEMMATNELKVHFPIKKGLLRRTVDHVRAVDGITAHIRAGETLGIVGESGSGKTTLGLALLRLIPSDGPIVFCGESIDTYNSKALRRMRSDMQLVFQDPFSSLNPRMSVGDIIAEGLQVHFPALSRDERTSRVCALLEKVGLEANMADRYPHEFSGGQRQRIGIARAMILKPKFVVLDEPTSALDLSVQTQIIDLLKTFQKEDQLGYMFISHDLRVVKAISHRLIVMRNGKVVESGDAASLFEQPQSDYTKLLMDAAFAE